ncbi:YoaK family protein [Larkinella sp. VNQ87]|uniref:YoaK family protein n=1 Tax=Larkinella sp. VNQ87 TaxID=3400921 RepID=UPI003C11AE84
MQPVLSVRYVSFLLTFVAGFCDTVTFIAADEVFSAHVTGNFIVLAYDLVNRSETQAWLKLLTFPVFVLAVMIGRWIDQKLPTPYGLLRLEGFLLIGSGMQAFMADHSTDVAWMLPLITLQIVFAMGLQNTFGKLYSRETYGPSTVMTGNVTQAALDSIDLILQVDSVAKRESLNRQIVLILGFLAGCLLGAFAAQGLGLGVVVLPGLLLVGFFFRPVLLRPNP